MRFCNFQPELTLFDDSELFACRTHRRPSFVFICASVFMFMVRDNPDDAMQVHRTGHLITSWNKPFNVDMLRLFQSLRATRSVVSS